MKSIKTLMMALALGAASSSYGAISTTLQQVYITGSTGFRGTVNTYFANNYSNNAVATDKALTSLANWAAAKNIAFTNIPVTVGGVSTNVDVILSWGGSEAGLQATLCPTNHAKPEYFLDLAKLTIPTYTGAYNSAADAQLVTGLPAAGPYTSSTYTTARVATIAFADNGQALSYFYGGKASQDGITYLLAQPASGAVTGAAAGTACQKVAVIPFNFYANNGAPFTNITHSAFWDLATAANGTPLSEITGLASDATSSSALVALIGRNVDSGTRMNMQAITHIPKSTSLYQYSLTTAGGAITGATYEPAASINGISMGQGNNGEPSGGTLAGWLTNTYMSAANTANGDIGASQNTYFVSYIALVDAVGQYANGIKPLAYNGVVGRCYDTNATLSGVTNPATITGSVAFKDQGFTNVTTGSYPYWGYEHIFYNTNNAGGNATVAGATTNLYSTLITAITNQPSTNSTMFGAIQLNDMQVQRTESGDGGAVTPGAALK